MGKGPLPRRPNPYPDARAYDAGAFDNDIQCPVSIELIEIYIQILLPAYQVTLGFEKNSCNSLFNTCLSLSVDVDV